MSISSAIIDVIILSISIFIIITGFKRGLARVILELVAWLLTLVLATYLSAPLASAFYGFTEPAFVGKIDKKAEVLIDDKLEASIEEIFEDLPVITSNTAIFFGTTPSVAANEIFTRYSDKEDVSVGKILNLTIKPFVLLILRGIIFTVIFILLLPILKWAAYKLDKLFNVPVISQFNRFLGMIFGVLQACIIILILSCAIELTIYFTSDKNEYINSTVVEDTYVYKYFHENNPIIGIFETEDL